MWPGVLFGALRQLMALRTGWQGLWGLGQLWLEVNLLPGGLHLCKAWVGWAGKGWHALPISRHELRIPTPYHGPATPAPPGGSHFEDRLVVLSDVWLDKQETFSALGRLLAGRSMGGHREAVLQMSSFECGHTCIIRGP